MADNERVVQSSAGFRLLQDSNTGPHDPKWGALADASGNNLDILEIRFHTNRRGCPSGSKSILLTWLPIHCRHEPNQPQDNNYIQTLHPEIYRTFTAEPGHSISYNTACAPSENSDQPVHPHSLISLRCLPDEAMDKWLPIVPCENFDQTVRMRKLIRVLAGSLCTFVGSTVARLYSCAQHNFYSQGKMPCCRT